MLRLAGVFGLPVVAEGVETAEQVATLRALGCDVVQGYYFSRPLPAGEFEHLIAKRKEREDPASAG